MIAAIDQILPGIPIVNILLDQAVDSQQLYLVGGMIRDILKQQPGHDLDFVATGDVIKLARKTADKIDAAFYVMDAERRTARLLYTSPVDRRRWILDFSTLQGETIFDDLTARDFTCNSMAVDLRDLSRLIDPLDGARDIKNNILRMSSPSSFIDDPLRTLRAVRQAVEFNYRMTADTIQALKRSTPNLVTISVERQRDELFKMLEGGKAAAALRTGFRLGVFHTLLPEVERLRGVDQSSPHTLDVFDHTLAVVAALDILYNILVQPYSDEKGADLLHGLAVLELGRFRKEFSDHFASAVTPDRTLLGLLMLAGLYHDVAKPLVRTVDEDGRMRFIDHENLGAEIARERGRALMLSGDEVDRLSVLVKHHMRIHQLAKSGVEISRRAIYRFFRDTGPAGVELVLIALADLTATYGVTITPDYWQQELRACRQLLDAWYSHKTEYVEPTRVVDGTDLMEALELSPGPRVGRLLESIREAQADGIVNNRDEALEYARKRLIIDERGRRTTDES